MLTLFDYLPSQNAYKVRLLLNHLQRPYRSVYISIFEGQGQSETYLDISPMGAVPALRLDDGRVLAESNAILTYLAEGTKYLPVDALTRASVLQWLFFECEQVQASVATLRHWMLTGKDRRRSDELMQTKRAASSKTLGVLERQLSDRQFLVGQSYTIADISVFAYVHLSEDAGISLIDFPNIQRWIDDVKAQPGFLDKVYPYSIDPYSERELP